METFVRELLSCQETFTVHAVLHEMPEIQSLFQEQADKLAKKQLPGSLLLLGTETGTQPEFSRLNGRKNSCCILVDDYIVSEHLLLHSSCICMMHFTLLVKVKVFKFSPVHFAVRCFRFRRHVNNRLFDQVKNQVHCAAMQMKDE